VTPDSGTFPRDSGLFAKKKVLLAGPPAGLLRGGASVLSLAGYVVRAAESVEELEALVPEKIPDLVIFDASFPPDGGVGACRRLREKAHWRAVSTRPAASRSSRPGARSTRSPASRARAR
jgi:CheY-like chemotaxis protein